MKLSEQLAWSLNSIVFFMMVFQQRLNLSINSEWYRCFKS